MKKTLFIAFTALFLALPVRFSEAQAQTPVDEEDWGDEGDWDDEEGTGDEGAGDEGAGDEGAGDEGTPDPVDARDRSTRPTSPPTDEDEDEDEGGSTRPRDDSTTSEGDDDEGAGEGSEDEEGQAGGLAPPGATLQFQVGAPPSADGDMQLVLPPILYERRGDVETIAGFPLFYLRQSAETTELVIPPYYLQRGVEDWDVLFPLFFWYRGEGHHTWMIPPLYSHSSPEGFDFGLPPLLMTGRHGASHYTLLPPLLTFVWGDEEQNFTLSPWFWRLRNRDTERWGVFPLLWVENTPRSNYQVVPPLFFRFEDRDEGTALTVVPPVYHRDEPNGSYWGFAGLLHHSSGTDWTSTTIPPLLFHYSEEPDAFRLTTPLFVYLREGTDETLVTPLYQSFRGATEMDAVAPFFFWVRDPRDGSSTLAVPPFFWHFEDPGSSDTLVLPFYASFERRGRNETWITPLVAQHRDLERGNETTWILPTLQISRWHDGDAVNFHPIFYFESVPSHRHAVFFPFYWDFESFEEDRNRYTVLFPFYARIREGNSVGTLFLNVWHRERRTRSGTEWEVNIVPFFSYGERSNGDHWWKIFHGVLGFERRGPYGMTTLFFHSFQTDGPPLPGGS